MGDISKHFDRQEIACKCGCGFDTMDAETLKVADEIRDFVGSSITPSSGARCLAHNVEIGGSKNSQHTKGRAMDLPVPDPGAVYRFLCTRYEGLYGIGVYHSFVHIDTRTNGPARWDNRS